MVAPASPAGRVGLAANAAEPASPAAANAAEPASPAAANVAGPGSPPTSTKSRRALLGAGLAGVGAMLLSGCGGSSSAATTTNPVAELPSSELDTDIQILSGLLEIERRTVAAYVAGIPLLPHPQAHAAERYMSEELEHTGELISLLKSAGVTAPPRPNSFALGSPRTGDAVLALLHELERLQVRAYLQGIPRLSPGPMRSAVATILTVDAQHVSMLRLMQGQTPVPSAFVTGSE